MLTTSDAATAAYRRNLGDGLLLRWSTAEDAEHITQLVGRVFRDQEQEPDNDYLANRVRLYMRGGHPIMGPGDYALVEDTRKEGNPLVAGVCLQRMDITYEGIPLHLGRPEIVATDPAYRRRGLIRELFAMIHARSQAEGHLLQGITGIRHFYRQFGYEYVLDLGGGRTTPFSLIPKAKEGATEPYALREATVEDIPLLSQLHTTRHADHTVWTTIHENYWRFQFEGWKTDPERYHEFRYFLIVDTAGKAVGFVRCPTHYWGPQFHIEMLEFAPGTNIQVVMPSLLRALHAYAQNTPPYKPGREPLNALNFELWRHHPVYDVLGKELAPIEAPPYAWYIRVPDVYAFIRQIAPALEKHLQSSPVSGYSGELKIDFFRGGLRLVFDNGHLMTVERWQAPIYDANASASCPALIFLQLLFGYRSLEELSNIFPDVWASREAALVLNTLFPARPSYMIPLS